VGVERKVELDFVQKGKEHKAKENLGCPDYHRG